MNRANDSAKASIIPRKWQVLIPGRPLHSKLGHPRQLTNKLQARIDRTLREIAINDYDKDGHVVTFDIEHDFENWTAAVYDLISCAQRMGHGWSINGFIDEELDLIATGTSIPGIKMVSCFCPRPGTPNAK